MGAARLRQNQSSPFLDFGLLCRMEKKHQLAMLASIVHISNGDWNALVYDLMEMDIVRPETNLRRVTMDLEEALGEVVFVNGIPDIKFSRVVFNKRRELQWQRILLFLRLGNVR
ncbi:hypothetical protein BHM03_00035799 [Ensete ventricosum]|nr:hypothetical protein BHM03_00035799 [Ensete ventricosum]